MRKWFGRRQRNLVRHCRFCNIERARFFISIHDLQGLIDSVEIYSCDNCIEQLCISAVARVNREIVVTKGRK